MPPDSDSPATLEGHRGGLGPRPWDDEPGPGGPLYSLQATAFSVSRRQHARSVRGGHGHRKDTGANFRTGSGGTDYPSRGSRLRRGGFGTRCWMIRLSFPAIGQQRVGNPRSRIDSSETGRNRDQATAFEPDRQQCAVHRPRTVGRHLRRIDNDLTHLDRVLLPILQRLARERPPEAEPVMLNLWQTGPQDRVRLKKPVRNLLFHLVERWPDLVRSQHDPEVPASTNRLEGWFGRSGPGPAWRGAEDRGRRPQLRALDGPGHGLNQARNPAGREATDNGLPPISTKVKQCRVQAIVDTARSGLYPWGNHKRTVIRASSLPVCLQRASGRWKGSRQGAGEWTGESQAERSSSQ